MTNRKIDGSSDVLGIIQQSRPMRTDCAEFLPASEVPPGARAAAQACSEVPDVAPTAFPRMIRTGLWGNGLIREDYQVLWVGGYSRLGSRLVGPCGFFGFGISLCSSSYLLPPSAHSPVSLIQSLVRGS